MDLAALETTLRGALASGYDAGDWDLTGDPATGVLDLATDDWTLHVEGWPDGIAFLAIDDEPADRSGYAAARQEVLGERGARFLRAANDATGGRLAAALARSRDPFAVDLAAAISSTTD